MSQVVDEEKKIEGEVENIIDENRVINFSDAVFAFAATLLVLKIDLPRLAGVDIQTQLATSLINLWPQYLANVISFLAIGYYWLTHHIIFGLVRRFNRTIVWMNIVFLILLSFLPFPVDLYGDYYNVPIVVVFYAASIAVLGFMLSLIWFYASHNNRLIDPKMSKRQIRFFTIKILMAPAIFTLSIPLVYLHPALTQFSWLFVILGVILVNRKYNFKKIDAKNDVGI
ncbi:MAG: DUF1211 domain-containing protein [Candidatus Levybacteria bacterium]|nr:DUF1211 domain-containing protein [Candidatus Levybacteria bacterium]